MADAVMNDLALWGKYAPAIRRWELILGRPMPEPQDTEGRLNPAMVEHMMGYPEGWVDGLSRTGQLRCLGNSILPLQAATAWAHLLGIDTDRQAGRQAGHLLPTPRTSDSNGAGIHGHGGPDLRTVIGCL